MKQQPEEPRSDAPVQRLELVKNGHRYVFTYRPGEETAVLAELVRLVSEDGSDLGWFDAAMLSHQLGMKLSKQIDETFE